MTRVCLVGEDGSNLQYELLSRETSREALATYDLERPFENSLAIRTVSVGAAVSLLNDLNWYLTRFVDQALVQEPSISDEEWLSRPLAERLRNGEIEPAETAEFCKIYGLERVGAGTEPTDATGSSDDATDPIDSSLGTDPDSTAPADAAGGDESEGTDDSGSSETDRAGSAEPTYRLVEPLYVRRTDGDLPGYDLRDVEDTLVVRLTEAEYSP